MRKKFIKSDRPTYTNNRVKRIRVGEYYPLILVYLYLGIIFLLPI